MCLETPWNRTKWNELVQRGRTERETRIFFRNLCSLDHRGACRLCCIFLPNLQSFLKIRAQQSSHGAEESRRVRGKSGEVISWMRRGDISSSVPWKLIRRFAPSFPCSSARPIDRSTGTRRFFHRPLVPFSSSFRWSMPNVGLTFPVSRAIFPSARSERTPHYERFHGR